ncbi:uncharacterized protein LOC113798606 [Dermatophagoides pteronyssinus]|uniref:uncharacterized protein LOC113798606 n=1 Tax=Dermatophagoides pteronyssinus TaxID=6956 RepID=UPI003F66DC72
MNHNNHYHHLRHSNLSIISIVLLLITIFFINKSLAFVEEYRFDPHLPRQAPEPEPEPELYTWGYMTPICEQICRNGHTCKKLIKILADQIDHCIAGSLYNCVANQPFHIQFSSKERYRRYYHMMNEKNVQCPIRLNQCPQGFLPSGFGKNDQQRQRCIPITQCKYLQQIYSHLNEIHDGIDLC